jgi:septation ring formation regulator EzrA
MSADGTTVSQLLAAAVGGGGLAAIAQFVRERSAARKTAAETNRDEAQLPLDLVHQATTVAQEQMVGMAAELGRLQTRLESVEAENDKLRGALAGARNDLDMARLHLRQMWQRLSEVDPTMPRPDWLDE